MVDITLHFFAMTIQLLNHSTKSDFTDVFNICIANTSQLKEEVFRLRYQIYCEELKYEPLAKFPEKMERDAYDSHSVHCLLKHNPSNCYVGCFRLVLPENPHKKFPLESFFPDNLMDFAYTSRLQFAEVSRLMVVSEFRNWSLQNEELVNQFNNERLQISFPLVTLGLYLSFICLLVEYDINFGLALMEPKLARHSRHVGITSHPIGEHFINFNGVRRPFLFRTTEILDNFNEKPKIKYLFNLIQATIRENMSMSHNYFVA